MIAPEEMKCWNDEAIYFQIIFDNNLSVYGFIRKTN